ncbi:MAG: hypothetical protein KAR54_03180 [Candidatus Pacebacteria bacterium]|nr:hypothetical protein [Candidatus Paceibacterota bacterium]
MTHFTEDNNPLACLYGNRLMGTRKKLEHKNNCIKIHYFTCKVDVCGDNCCRDNAQEKYGEYYDLHGEYDDKISGNRGVIEPLNGCKTLRRKGSKHDPVFSVKREKNDPAICYFDGWETLKALQVRVQNKI